MGVSVGPEPAVVVPDEATWTMSGRDPAGLGLLSIASAEGARVLLAPVEIPRPLVEAVLGEWRRAPTRLRLRGDGAVVLRGRPLVELLDDGRDGCSEPTFGDRTAGQQDPDGHDHHDMMAIVGEPSSDGLVMETIDFSFGPLSAALPGGLVVELSLDGDVVAACGVRATLRAGVDGPVEPPDPLAPAAWAVAGLVAAEVASETLAAARTQWERVALVELERSLSHLAWLRSLGRILGWGQLVDAAQRPVTALTALHDGAGTAASPQAVRGVAAALEVAERLVAGRRFASRTRGKGQADGERLVGPNARASGRPHDMRQDDPLYADLGFLAVAENEGDAWARARVRMAEARQSLALAADALERAQAASGAGVAGAFATAAGARVEGPRGLLLVSRATAEADPLHAALGAAATLAIASDAVVGLEWSAALATLASFDLSPWTVGG